MTRPRADSTSPRAIAARAAGVILALAAPAGSHAQVPAPTPMSPDRSVITQVGLDQRLGAPIPEDIELTDSRGLRSTTGELMGEAPLVLGLVYYDCPSICGMSLQGTLSAFEALTLELGVDYRAATVSFDPSEGPELARRKRAAYLARYSGAPPTDAWRFFTAAPEAIERLTKACGFRYVRDPETGEYAHPTCLIVLTPEGKISRYLYGLEYSPRDLRLAIVEASSGKVGGLADQALLLCYRYDPTKGKYGFYVITGLRIAAVALLLALGAFIGLSIRRERSDDARAGAPGEEDAP